MTGVEKKIIGFVREYAALIIFVLVLYGLYKLSDKIGTLVLGFGAAYAAYHFGHPIIACIIILAVFENLFSSSGWLPPQPSQNLPSLRNPAAGSRRSS